MDMKQALNAWTVDQSMDMEQTFAAVAKAGFCAIELNMDAPGAPHGLSEKTTASDYAQIRRLSEVYRLPVCSIASSLWWGAPMGRPECWDAAQALLHNQIQAAMELGATGILIVPGGMNDTLSLDATRKNCIDFLRSQREYIEKSGIFVGVENVWNGFFLSPYDMASFIDEVDSPLVGAYLDVGNMLAFSTPEYWIEVLGERIGKVHVKDYKRNGGLNSGGNWVDITCGSADWKKIIPALRKAGYDGYLVGEVFKSDPDMEWDAYYEKVSGEIGTICGY